MDSSIILWALFLGIGAEYILRCMILMERDSHEGPFPSSKDVRYARWKSTGHIQRVALFDWLRRLIGTYDIADEFGVEVWVIDERRWQVELFSCPHCLSFWCALPFSIGMMLALHLDIIWFIPIWLAISVISQIIYFWIWDNEE